MDEFEKIDYKEERSKEKDRNRVKNHDYFLDFIKRYEGELANFKVWMDDEISVKWQHTYVSINLHGYDSVSTVVETGNDWVEFKADLELGYERIKILRYKAIKPKKFNEGRESYMKQRNALRSHLNAK